ncbi:MAG: G1 family endopeptidase [Actinobacteria bacterium]|nr:G1 family endopeptidase [Actinomycetota bacterium]
MKPRLLALGVAAAAFLAIAEPATVAASAPAFTTGALVPSYAGEPLPAQNATVTSLNWAGYVVAPSRPVTSVSSSFVVPTVTSPGIAATWTGIGGYNSNDSTLIQAGVAEQSPGSLIGPDNAWYEMLPAPETPVTSCTSASGKFTTNCPVAPGNKVSVSISLASSPCSAGNNCHWAISIENATDGWTFQKYVTYASSEASAEWILEAPTLGIGPLPLGFQTVLPLMGSTDFGASYTKGAPDYWNGKPIASGNPVTVDMVGVGPAAEGQPSGLGSNGESFVACAYSLSCS